MKTETWVDPRPINWLALDFQQSIIFCSETKLVELVELQTTANQKSQTCRSFHHLRDKVPPQLADPKFQRVAAPEVHKSQRWTYLNDEMPRKNLTQVYQDASGWLQWSSDDRLKKVPRSEQTSGPTRRPPTCIVCCPPINTQDQQANATTGSLQLHPNDSSKI